MQNWCESGQIVGAEVLVIREREILLHSACGWADIEDGEPMERGTIFRVRSMTKPLVGTAVLMLVERGMLDLEDTAAEHVPAFDNARSNLIKIRHLLTHTAGFNQPGYPRGDVTSYNSLREAVDDVGMMGPQYLPGERFIYSDAGTATLGIVVSEVSGMPVGEFIEKEILEPLEMDDSYISIPPDTTVRRRTASSYMWTGSMYEKYWDDFEEPIVPFFRASGGLWTTALDYARFLYAWNSSGDGLLRPDLVRTALEPGALYDNYGMHWELYHVEEGETRVFGHGGSDGTVAMALRQRDVLALFLTQSRGTLAAEAFKKLVMEEFGVIERVEIEPVYLDPDRVTDYEGVYTAFGMELMIRAEGEALLIESPRNPPARLIHTGEDAFVIEHIDMEVEFERDPWGRVDAVKIVEHGAPMTFTRSQ